MCAWFQNQVETLGTKRSDESEALEAWHSEVSERLLSVSYRDRGELGRPCIKSGQSSTGAIRKPRFPRERICGCCRAKPNDSWNFANGGIG